MKPYVYSIAYLPGLLALAGLFFGAAWVWSVPLFIFVVVPLVEVITHGSAHNPSPSEQDQRRSDVRFNRMVYGIVPLQLAAVGTLIWMTSQSVFTPVEWLGAVLSVGILCGMYGLNVGHELGHRQSPWGRRAAIVLMGSSLYPHFLLEHNRGHHRHVATPDDPASAAAGQWVYRFWVQSIVGGFKSAYTIDAKHVRRVWLITAGIWFGVAIVFGGLAALSWLAAGVVGITLLETVNYLEHYGLRRQRKENGRYERPQPRHSWNANHPLGRALLFDLTRHSDHHAYPGRPYQILRSHAAAPLLPTGYPGMILLSFVPPLFFRIMHPHLQREMARLDEVDVA